MEPTTPTEEQSVTSVIQEASEIVDQVSVYGSLITNSLYLIIGGMIAVFILHKLTSKFLYPYLKNTRLLKVIFGALYVLILVVTMLIVVNRIGIDTSAISKIAILAVLIGAVAIFFLVPFLPRLPFKIGEMIEINGVLGTVDNISTAHTTLRTFDGAMVFIPNPLLLASKITNFHDLSERRIAMNLTVNLDFDIEEVRSLILKIINEDERVVKEPAVPVVRATEASADGVELTAFCWVKNADFLDVRSDLWLRVVVAFNNNDHVTMSRSKQDIYVVDEIPEDGQEACKKAWTITGKKK
jgi:small conductance mechanosensitive channel